MTDRQDRKVREAIAEISADATPEDVERLLGPEPDTIEQTPEEAEAQERFLSGLTDLMRIRFEVVNAGNETVLNAYDLLKGDPEKLLKRVGIPQGFAAALQEGCRRFLLAAEALRERHGTRAHLSRSGEDDRVVLEWRVSRPDRAAVDDLGPDAFVQGDWTEAADPATQELVASVGAIRNCLALLDSTFEATLTIRTFAG